MSVAKSSPSLVDHSARPGVALAATVILWLLGLSWSTTISVRLVSTSVVIAYVDESARPGPEGVYYLMTAGVVVGAEVDHARRVLMKLQPPQGRFHWRQEGERGRLAMLEVMAELGMAAFVTWDYPIGNRRQEPARRRCLTTLLDDLRHEGVDELVIERRHQALDHLDRQTILDAQHAGLAPSNLLYRFEAPKIEPLLWVPDAIAGAVGMHLAGDSTYYDRLHLGGVLVVRRVAQRA